MECEDCKVNVSTLYCLGCKKHMCIKCEENKHPSSHTTVPSQTSICCDEHSLPFDLFCETCDKLLCSVCTKAHHASYHSIQSLIDVFRKKKSLLHSILSDKGYAKKQLIEAQVELRKNQFQGLLKEYSSLEREIHDTHQAMSKRLELNVAPLIQELEKDLEQVNSDIKGLSDGLELIETSSKYTFLNKYKTLLNNILNIKSKGIRAEKNVDFDSIPAELLEWNERARLYEDLTRLNEVKNNILWDIWSGRISNPEAAASREITQWSRLTDQYLEKISKMAMSCYFCQLPLNEENVNGECRMNTRELSLYNRDTKIPSRHLGSGYHYFNKK
jgi:B-box zinc finger